MNSWSWASSESVIPDPESLSLLPDHIPVLGMPGCATVVHPMYPGCATFPGFPWKIISHFHKYTCNKPSPLLWINSGISPSCFSNSYHWSKLKPIVSRGSQASLYFRITGRACKLDCWAACPEWLIHETWGEVWEFAFQTSSLVMLMLMLQVQESHFENH